MRNNGNDGEYLPKICQIVATHKKVAVRHDVVELRLQGMFSICSIRKLSNQIQLSVSQTANQKLCKKNRQDPTIRNWQEIK